MGAKIRLNVLVNEILNGAVLVCSITLVALGLFVIFGMMRVINMAHGALFMLGAYTIYLATLAHVSFWIGLALAAGVVGAIGALIELVVVRRLYGRADLSTLLATWGISIALQEIVQIVLGPQPRSVSAPVAGAAHLLGTTYPTYDLVLIALSLAIIAGMVALLNWTRFGLYARATMDNPAVAATLGIRTRRMFTLSFALGSALAGVAGAILAPIIGIDPTMGLNYLARSFFVVIMGGMTSLAGILGSGFIVGGTESVFTNLFNATLASIVVLLVVMGVMLVRPRGLFRRS